MISIIITNFNKSNHIKKTLESCANQVDKKFEIIFFDDRSTDNSLQIVENFKNKNKKIKLILIKRRGKKSINNCYNQISAVKKSIEYSSGNYISLLDADDIFLKKKIFFLNSIIHKTKKKILYNSYYILNKKKYSSNKRHFLIRKFIWPIFPPTSCLTVEKKLFQKVIKKIAFRKFPSCWLDFRLAIYFSKYYLEEIVYTKKKLTIYIKNNEGNDNMYTNIFNIYFWKRKFEAFVLKVKI